MAVFITFLAAATTAIPEASAIEPRSWFSTANYPIEAMQQGIEGSVTFDVGVDPQGKPTDCRVLVSSGYQILDKATCDVVKTRGQFIPAKGSDGKAVAGHYSTKVNWRMPIITAAPYYRAVVIDFSPDPTHPVCTTQFKGTDMEGMTCAQLEQQAISQGLDKKVTRIAHLKSIGGVGSDAPYQGEAGWGPRVFYLATDQYFLKGSYPIACINVAAEGLAVGQDGCKAFPVPRTLSDLDKRNATRRRIETSMFAVISYGVMELEPGHFFCGATAGEYINREIAALPIRKPVTVRFKLTSEHPDPEWPEQTALYFETLRGRMRIMVGKGNDGTSNMYVALLNDKTGESEIVDQYPFTTDWIDLALTLKDDGKVQVTSRGHQASLDLGTPSPVKTELHCHSGAFEIQVLRPLP